MKTVEEIMKVTECTKEQAEKLRDELTILPRDLGEFISDNLDRVNAFNADEIEVIRCYNCSRYGANIIVKRRRKDFPVIELITGTPWYDHWKYGFNYLINYVGESCY